MSSPAAAGDVFMPALPPIRVRMRPSAVDVSEPESVSSSASPSTAPEDGEPMMAPVDKVVVRKEVEEAEPTTTAAAAAAAAAAAGEEEEEEEPRTPTTEGSKLRPPTECPPAPRKPAWTAPSPRTRPSPSAAKRRLYFDVPRDLSAVFRSLPPKKRIRAPPCSSPRPCRPRCGAARADGSAL